MPELDLDKPEILGDDGLPMPEPRLPDLDSAPDIAPRGPEPPDIGMDMGW
jgi:hypothetical protein